MKLFNTWRLNLFIGENILKLVLLIVISLFVLLHFAKAQVNHHSLLKDDVSVKTNRCSSHIYQGFKNDYLPQKGDTLIAIARKNLPEEVNLATVSRYADIIFECNPQAFLGNHRNQLRRDQKLLLPEFESVSQPASQPASQIDSIVSTMTEKTIKRNSLPNAITDAITAVITANEFNYFSIPKKILAKKIQLLNLPTITFLPIIHLWQYNQQKDISAPFIFLPIFSSLPSPSILSSERQANTLSTQVEVNSFQANEKGEEPWLDLDSHASKMRVIHYIWNVIWFSTIIALIVWIFLVWRAKRFKLHKKSRLNMKLNENLSHANTSSQNAAGTIAAFSDHVLLAFKDKCNDIDFQNTHLLASGRRAALREIDFVNQGLQYIDDDDRIEQALHVQLARSPRDVSALSQLAQFYAQRKNIAAFREQANLLYEETEGEGKLWRNIEKMGRELDPNDLLYNNQLEVPLSNQQTLQTYTDLNQDDLDLNNINNVSPASKKNKV